MSNTPVEPMKNLVTIDFEITETGENMLHSTLPSDPDVALVVFTEMAEQLLAHSIVSGVALHMAVDHGIEKAAKRNTGE